MTVRALVALALLWMVSGVYTVAVDEVAVVCRFGRALETPVPPGLHLGFPFGIDRVCRVKLQEQKRLAVGFETGDDLLGRPGRSEFFTGDQNLMTVQLLVQYTVQDPRAYLFGTANLESVLRDASLAAISRTVAVRPVDALLTNAKAEVQRELETHLQAAADRAGCGVHVSSASLRAVQPPAEVADAFLQVATAREDRDRIISDAQGYALSVVPQARGDAERMRQEAEGWRVDRSRRARGDAARFNEQWQAYRKAPAVTSTRLYLETVEAVLPAVRLLTVDREGRESAVDLQLLRH